MGSQAAAFGTIGLLALAAAATGCATTGSPSAVKAALAAPVSQEALDRGEMVEWKFRYQKIAFLGERERRVRHAQALVDQLLAASLKPEPKMVVRVQDDAISSAFAPGGRYLYVSTRLLHEADSKDELAFVFAHEIAHVHLGHLAREQRTEIFASTTTAFANLIAAALKHESAALATSLYARYGGLVPIKHDRDHESEADALGALYAARAGFDVTRARDFLVRSAGFLMAQSEAAATQSATDRDLLKDVQSKAAIDATAHQISPETKRRVSPRELKDQRVIIARHQLKLTEAEILYHWASSHPEPETRLGNIDAVVQYLHTGQLPKEATAQVKSVVASAAELQPPATASLAPGAGLRDAQQWLNASGFACGNADGRFGARTRSCLREYQTRQGLPATGELDTPTRTRLGLAAR